MDLTMRPRRLRTSAKLRKMVRETRMDKSSLVYPMFVMDGENKKEEIPTMPGQYRYTLDRMPEILNEMADAGVGSVMLFGIPDHKDEVGSQAYACDGIIQRALEKAKKELAHLEGFLTGVTKKLSNENFVAHAPAAVVEKERKKQADAMEKIAMVKAMIKALK